MDCRRTLSASSAEQDGQWFTSVIVTEFVDRAAIGCLGLPSRAVPGSVEVFGRVLSFAEANVRQHSWVWSGLVGSLGRGVDDASGDLGVERGHVLTDGVRRWPPQEVERLGIDEQARRGCSRGA
jgi:hypothetical protein